jgi:translation initiation factor IF-3
MINERIKSKDVRLIDDEGVNHGVIKTSEALSMAIAKDLDLVLVSPDQDPPVAKILDYGKYKFESEKRAKDARKKQHTVELKEVKMRYKIDTHDYEVKVKNIKKFLLAGNKVKIMVMLKGREIQHTNLAFDLIKRINEDLQDENYILEKRASMEGKNAVMIIGPVGAS